MDIGEQDPWRSMGRLENDNYTWPGADKTVNNVPKDNSPPLLTTDPFGSTTVSDTSLSAEVKETMRNSYSERNVFNTEGSGLEHSVWGQPPTNQIEVISGTPLDCLDHNVSSDSISTATRNEYLDIWIENVRKTYDPLSSNIVVVEEIPEREGLLFKHTNYLVRHLVALPNTTPSSNQSVIRRYSDFNWLQEVLLQKYPFRMVPELPPKKIGAQNSDIAFLTRRRKGLSRFINLVMKHPALRFDDLVLTFLTVPTDLSSWRKQANYDTTEEFTDQKIDKTFISMWHKELSVRWNEADAKIDELLESWIKISVLVERYEKRMKQVSDERRLLGSVLDEFTKNSEILYPLDEVSIHGIKSNLGIVSKHLNNLADIAKKERQEVDEELSVKFKTFIDVTLSLRGVFERYKMMAGNNIPQLQRRVEINLEKLQSMERKPDTKGNEYEKVKHIIQRDRRAIADQLNRSWLIRKCILEEFVIFQETQFVITNIFQEWAKMHVKYTNENTEIWEKLYSNLGDMPLTRS